MTREIKLPISEEAIRELRAGDEVELSGRVITGRDQACARLYKMLEADEAIPVELTGQLLYFVGPSPTRPGEAVGSAGPTTAGRMNTFMPALLARGLRGFIGKGYISAEVKGALKREVGVYFGAIGGTGALLAQSIREARVLAFPELLSEAIHEMVFDRFPAVVLHDCHGSDLYEMARGGIK